MKSEGPSKEPDKKFFNTSPIKVFTDLLKAQTETLRKIDTKKIIELKRIEEAKPTENKTTE